MRGNGNSVRGAMMGGKVNQLRKKSAKCIKLCARNQYCVADDFGYEMPGQRQKRVS